MTKIDLESQLAMVQARNAQRQQQAQQAEAQRSQGPQGSPQAQAATPAQTPDAAAERNAVAGDSWSSFRAAPNTNAAPEMPSASPQASTEAAPSSPQSESLQRTLQANPSIRTNQDLINSYYQRGGGTWDGASRLATADGQSLNQLVRNRSGLVNRSGEPSTQTPPSTQPPPSSQVPANPPATQTPTPTAPGETPAPSTTGANGVQTYRPGSPEQIALFTEAGRRMGLSDAEARRWATSPGLQNILQRESGGQVGRPNYTYGDRARDPSRWSSIHDELRDGRKTARSSATGLGQLLLSNVERYYPSGRQGIGNPMEEAVGMMRYIQDRYRTPENAWSQYGRNHEGY